MEIEIVKAPIQSESVARVHQYRLWDEEFIESLNPIPVVIC